MESGGGVETWHLVQGMQLREGTKKLTSRPGFSPLAILHKMYLGIESVRKNVRIDIESP